MKKVLLVGVPALALVTIALGLTKRPRRQRYRRPLSHAPADTSSATSAGAKDARPSPFQIWVRRWHCRCWRAFHSVPLPGIGSRRRSDRLQLSIRAQLSDGCVEGDGAAADIKGDVNESFSL